MTESIQAYPLTWPDGWRRTPAHQRKAALFGKGETRPVSDTYSHRYKAQLTVADGLTRVLDKLDRMGVHRSEVIISTNVVTRLDGLPRSGQRMPDDPGAAVYWRDTKVAGWPRRCMAIDRYTKVQDNRAAIAATLEAMRAIERHGGAEILDRAFTGFIALAAPEQPWQVLGVPMTAKREEIEDAYRRLAMKHHPDRGGDAGQMARINTARDAMIERCTQV